MKSAAAKARAFTLLEVLLALAIIGLIAGALVSGSARILDNQATSPDEVFWKAVEEARKMALKSEREVTLRYVNQPEAGKGFVVAGEGGSKPFMIPSPGDLEVTLLAPQKGGGLVVIAGTVIETQNVDHVTFFPDGTCSAFRVQFFQNGGVRSASVDPWTCAPALTQVDPNNPWAQR